jgi:hypothetical protein
MNPNPPPPVAEPAGSFQIRKMAGYSGLGELQNCHKVADAKLIGVEKQCHDPKTGFIFQRLEYFCKQFHETIVSVKADGYKYIFRSRLI